MRSGILMAIAALAGILATESLGQVPEITSFQGNGRVTWTNDVDTDAVYRLEWAAQLDGPWHSFTYQPMNTIDALSHTVFTVQVPMFYRVVMATNEPPQGMVWIDGGDVEIGQVGVQAAEPVHTNFISGFWMDATEVTKGQWDSVADWAAINGYDLAATNGFGKTNNHPVQYTTWYMCVKWCNARSEKDGLTPCYYTDESQGVIYKAGNLDIINPWVNWSANGYRLPTEPEWEKAARGGRQGHQYPWGGDTIQHTRANYFSSDSYAYDTSLSRGYHPVYSNGVTPYTSPTASFPANGYGLYDMSGNVMEWCWDWSSDYTENYETDPRGPETGPQGVWRIVRGGAWNVNAPYARCAARGSAGPNYMYPYYGFRSVRGP